MARDGFLDGHRILATLSDSAGQGQVAVFSTPSGLTLKRGFRNPDGTITLRSSDPEYPDQQWPVNAVRVVAVLLPRSEARWC
jgi:SOS-response transcriptional repressor LexA